MDSAKQNSKLLAYQIFVILLTFYVSFQVIYYMMLTITMGKVCLVYVTFLFALVVDQTKSLVTLSLVYIIVVRRFGFLKENEKEWINKEIYEEKKENAIPKLKNFILKMLESRLVEGFSQLVIWIYAGFILFDLTFSEQLNTDPIVMS